MEPESVLGKEDRIVRRRVVCALAAALVLGLPAGASAHEIPSQVTVRAFLKPTGTRLHLLVRAPLNAMRDIDFPKRGPGFLDLAKADASLRDAAARWISDSVELYEGKTLLRNPKIAGVRASLPSDRSFATYDEALANLTGAPLPDGTELYWDQGVLDTLLEYPIQSERSEFSIHPGFARLGSRVITVLRFLPPGRDVRAFEFPGDPGLVRLDPRWHQAAVRFVESGFFHILEGADHLLFLFCLVTPLRRIRALIAAVTAFTVAHSVTLIAAAFGLAPVALWFPPLVETLISISIVWMAVENILGIGLERRWMAAFAFGLVHGFGFSFALGESLQFAGAHLLTSLFSFNAGVELGQVLAVLLLIPLLGWLFRYVPERIGTILLSALVLHTGWHWMIDRAYVLSRFQWPDLDAGLLALTLRWLTIATMIAGLLWLVSVVLRQRSERRAGGESPGT